MNWKEKLFKPKWQNKDAAVRRQAVASERDERLTAALPDMLASDPDAGVRAAAAKRVDDARILATALAAEKTPEVRAAITERLRQALIAIAPDDSPAPGLIDAIRANDDRQFIEAIACDAAHPELREAALTGVSRQGLLGDRAISDPAPGLRRLAARMVTQHSTLRRVIGAVRTSDKELYQALSERLHRELLAEGDEEAIRQEALALCEQMESWLMGPARPDEDALEAVRKRWQAVETRAPEPLAHRFRRDLASLKAPQEPPSPPSEEVASEPEVIEGPETQETAVVLAESPPPAAEPMEPEAADARLAEVFQVIRATAESKKLPGQRRLSQLAANVERAWSALESPNAEDRETYRQSQSLLERLGQSVAASAAQAAQLLEQAQSAIDSLKQALADGELHKSLELRTRIQELGRQIGNRKEWNPLQSQLNAMLGRLRELRDWQHWANDKVRKRLIDDMETLPAAGLHPDAVLERIKVLQAEWKQLEASEQIPGDRHYAAAPWMWRKFNAAGRAAFELTKPFLDKRSELQSQKQDEAEASATRLDELARAEPVDWQALARGMGQVRQALRSLGNIPARSRSKVAERLKTSLAAANDLRQGHYAEIEKEKQKLIREAAQLQHLPERAEAIGAAKQLQSRWTAAGALWRSRENEMWKAFREHLDPLFQELEAERQSERAEEEAHRSKQQRLLGALDEILALENDRLPEQAGRVHGLEGEWRDLGRTDRKLRERFERQVGVFRERCSKAERQEDERGRERLWAMADLVQRAERLALDGDSGGKVHAALESEWATLGDAADTDDTESLLIRRFTTALAGKVAQPDTEEAIESTRKLCICLEFLAGLPSPDSEKDLRMQYQVERLSASMSGERERVSAVDEARQLEDRWLTHDCLPEDAYQEFRRRIRAAMAEISE